MMLVELDGRRYRVSLAPAENPGRSAPVGARQAVCFETPDGRWVGSTLIHDRVERMEEMTQTQLRRLLRQAVREG